MKVRLIWLVGCVYICAYGLYGKFDDGYVMLVDNRYCGCQMVDDLRTSLLVKRLTIAQEKSLESSDNVLQLEVVDRDGSQMENDRNTKKVHFKEGTAEADTNMSVEPAPSPKISWKDKLLGTNPNTSRGEELNPCGGTNEDDIEFLEGDIQRSVVNGIPAIDFSERIQQILFKEMELTVVVKLLGRNIGYGALSNRINGLWSPSKPFHLMDIENGYYLAKFHSIDDYSKVLTQGPWMVYGQYLTVQPWTKEFTPLQPYPSVVLAWIRLPGLPGFLYKKKILEEIGKTIGKVVRLDLNTDSRTRGRFARMAVYINLDKPLTGQVLVNGMKQKVEYEALPTICFSCGKYGHTKELCQLAQTALSPGKAQSTVISTEIEGNGETEIFGPWMVVERKSQNLRNKNIPKSENKGKRITGNRFEALTVMGNNGGSETEVNNRDEEEIAKFWVNPKVGPHEMKKKKQVFRERGRSINFSQLEDENINSGELGNVLINSKRLITFNGKVDQNSIKKVSESGASGPPFPKELTCPPSVAHARNVAGPSTPIVNFSNFEKGSTLSQLTIPLLISNSSNITAASLGNNGTLSFIQNSCTNPIYDFQVLSANGGQVMADNSGTPMPSMPEAKSGVPIIDLNSNKHTAVSFKEKGPVDGAIKNRSSGKSMGTKEGNFWATRKIDLRFIGPSYTWKRGNTSERLDRALANDDWISVFAHSLVYHLPRIKSNHRPILLKTNPELSAPRGRPFRFLAGWTKHANFKDLVSNRWRYSGNMAETLSNFTSYAKEWNREEAVKFFEDLYGECSEPISDIPSNVFPSLKEQDIDFLKKSILNDEIKKALFDMAPLKAPGSDGYHAIFFQSQWDLVGGAKDHPEDFSQFRPINLCSVLYKLVMKVIANRLKVVFPNFISPEQAGFIAGRNISDNVIIAQEVIHSMRSKKTGKNWMAIKLDLEKAYDRISWEFIHVSLVAAGIPEGIRKDIMNAISSSTMQILWNGVPSRPFKPARGIRQGCPLSPFLFVLCMEWLGNCIKHEMGKCRWHLIRLARSGPDISHLFFADDLVIFVNTKLEDQISQFLGFQKVLNLGKYLGVPLLHDRVTKNTFNFVIDKPKTCGGLGFRYLHDHNTSFLMKIGFNIVARKDDLWVRVLRSKYGWKSQLPESIHRSQCSHLWRSLSKAWPLISENLLWSVGNGETIRGWKDNWIPKLGPLLSYVPAHSRLNMDSTPKDWVLQEGCWNIDMLKIWLPDDIIKRILSIPPPHPTEGEDRIIWACTESGSFTIRSAYRSLKENTWRPKDDNWNIIWKYQGPQRVRIFLWLVASQRVLTNSERFRRGFGQSSACSRCGHNLEDIMHALRDCPTAKKAWMLVVPLEKQSRFFSDSMQNWLSFNLSCHIKLQDKGITWSCLFGILAWRLWKNKNLFIFQNIDWTPLELIKSSLSWAQNFEAFITRSKLNDTPPGHLQHCSDNWVFLYSDGVVAKDSKNGATDGVVRDRDGNWVLGYTHYLRKCSPLEAELWSILDGVFILINRGYKKIKIRSDNLEVVRILSTKDMADSGSTLIRRVKGLLLSEDQWEIKHIPRENNLTADQMAKIGLHWQNSLRTFEAPPDMVASIFQHDKAFNVS
ncbi:reverse transcriptase [Gossypium australe]|uniref:Reverse transcriptase n=1 Tax=Gossypium australe TaxID=47621 RepID=A0A5B6U6F1_9ROSI|nr:reverse transcriptase [Gossypium australe]